MEKTKYQFKCDTNVAKNIITQFLQANNYKQQTSSNGVTYYKFSDAIAVGFLEYEFIDELVIIYAYLRSEKKPMPLDNSFVGSIPKSHYKTIIDPLLKALSNASSQFTSAQVSDSENINSQAINSNSTNQETLITQTASESTNNTIKNDDSYNQFAQESQKSKEKFAIIAFVISLVGLIFSFFGLIYGWIIIFLEYYFAIQGLKTKKEGLAIAAIVLATLSLIISILLIISSAILN